MRDRHPGARKGKRVTDMLSQRRILVVEDEMLVLMSIETMLEDLGCTTIESSATVAGALALLENASFDAAILDVNLDGERSYPVADALIAAGIPFVFSTGYGDNGDRSDLAGRPVLRKPYLPTNLKDHLVRLLNIQLHPTAA